MNPLEQHQQHLNRRHFFGRSATGIGTAALASLLHRDGFATEGVTLGEKATGAESPRIGGLPDLPHFAPKAKRVIYLFQNGAPTHVDLFDWKPNLKKKHSEPVPNSYIGDRRFSTMTGKADGKLLLAPVEPFSQHGESGAWVSNFMPHTAKVS
ncbi:MAG: sulfatase, partial [Rhodopirellula sp.]|nr:sulfatase [Rhodopirellula sp.]